MTDPTSKVTIATSSGVLWLALIIHVSAGVVALSSGFLAIVVAKGGRFHRRAGMVFVVAMVVMGIFAAGIALYENRFGSMIGGVFSAYFVVTALATVRPLGGRHAREVNVALTLFASGLALIQLKPIALALDNPSRPLNGVPAPMVAFIGIVTILAALGDWRLLRVGSIAGTRRLARHLWRMCFGLFIASGSFFLGQMTFLPEPLRIVPVLLALGIAPLFVLVYWMWRIRLRKRLQGMILRPVVEARL